MGPPKKKGEKPLLPRKFDGMFCSCSYAVAKKELKEFTKDYALKNDDKAIKAGKKSVLAKKKQLWWWRGKKTNICLSKTGWPRGDGENKSANSFRA